MRKQKKYHYIYRTTCQITGKFYVGMHSTDTLEDGYLGSGKVLGYSIAKHGRENHKREILEFLQDREALKLREQEVVNEELLNDPLCINLKYGGEGGWENIAGRNLTSTKFIAYKESGRLAENGRAAIRAFSSEQRARSSKTKWNDARQTMLTAAQIGLAVMNSPTANEKRKATYAERGHSRGEKNSQFGSCWVTNGTPIKIKKEQLEEYLAAGYSRGRKQW